MGYMSQYTWYVTLDISNSHSDGVKGQLKSQIQHAVTPDQSFAPSGMPYMDADRSREGLYCFRKMHIVDMFRWTQIHSRVSCQNARITICHGLAFKCLNRQEIPSWHPQLNP